MTLQTPLEGLVIYRPSDRTRMVIALAELRQEWQQAANGAQLATGRIQTRHKGDFRAAREKADSVIERGFCRHCGAWRGTFGLEPTYQLYIAHAVEVFRAVHRVLRPDGTLWLNMGDSYASAASGASAYDPMRASTLQGGKETGRNAHYDTKIVNRLAGLKPKNICGIPWRLAFALQDDGWYLRQDIIWAKPSPMPESVTDRCSKAHEYLFLFAKRPRYFFDAEAIKEPQSEGTHERFGKNPRPSTRQKLAESGNGIKNNNSFDAAMVTMIQSDGHRNKRSVWTIASEAFPEAHFATFPPGLVEPCVKAGTSKRGCCAKCGAPWARVIEQIPGRGCYHDHSQDLSAGMSQPKPNALDGRQYYENHGSPKTFGWYPTCKCDGAEPLPKYPKRPKDESQLPEWRAQCAIVTAQRKQLCDSIAHISTPPCTVLDPFGGSGTTAMVADRLQRNAVLIDRSPKYIAMAERRVRDDLPLFAQIEAQAMQDEVNLI